MKRMTVRPVKVEGGYTIIAFGSDGTEESPIEYRVIETRERAIEEIDALYGHSMTWDLRPLSRNGWFSISCEG